MKNKYVCDHLHKEHHHEMLPKKEVLDGMSKLLKVASDATRIKILYTLLSGPQCVCDIADAIEASQSLVSHQLRILRENDLVRCEKEKTKAIYYLADNHVKEIFDTVYEHITESKND